MAAVTPLLVTRGLTRRFGGLTAVDHVDFELPAGQIRAVIGPNGAGKTTFVSLVCGRIMPTSGEVVFDGEEITGLPAHERVRRGIAYTFQITSVFPNLTVFDNVALSVQRSLMDGKTGSGGRFSGKELSRGVEEALARVHLSDRTDMLAGKLAYGHQRLLEVAMGLALKPRLLILDEPTQGLSDAEIESFIALVKEIARDATVLLIEHNMPVVMALADRITVMSTGAVLAEGTPEEIRANPHVQHAYLGSPEDA